MPEKILDTKETKEHIVYIIQRGSERFARVLKKSEVATKEVVPHYVER